MTQQGVNSVHAILLAPVQLLLEGVVLLADVSAAQASVVALTITNLSRVVLVLRVVVQIQVALQCESEVVGQHDIRINRAVHGVADFLVGVQLVLPDDVAIGILVAGLNHLTISIDIRTTIPQQVALGITLILASKRIVQMHRINGRHLTDYTEWV